MRRLDRVREDAWQDLFRAHYAGLVRHAAFLVGERAAAEDIAQEAFLRLMRHPLRRGGDPRAWLWVVAGRLAYNYLRGERRRRAREERLFQDRGLSQDAIAAPPGSDAEREAERDAERDALREALGRLQPRDRLALLLRAEGGSYADIAAALGLRATSVGTILARATRRLRSEYEQERGDAGTSKIRIKLAEGR